MSRGRAGAIATLTGALLVGSHSVRAQANDGAAIETSSIDWRQEWPRFSAEELTLTITFGAAFTGLLFLPTDASNARWTESNAFDSSARSALRLTDEGDRNRARIASDVLSYVGLGLPLVVDALLLAGAAHRAWDTSLEMSLISLESYAVSLLVWRISSLLAKRSRPGTPVCESGDPSCVEERQVDGFFSLATMNAFTGAFLTCLHHTKRPLLGNEAADASMCAGSLAMATAVGALRVLGDAEYASDVLVGATVGFLAGYLMPYLLHYSGGARSHLADAFAFVPTPMFDARGTYGLSLGGTF